MRVTTVAALVATAGAVHAAVNARLLRRPVASATSLPDVPVLVPARDEAHAIDACVQSIVGQAGVGEVVVLDDESSDGTAAVAAAAGARVVRGTPPPDGWLGKVWALDRLANEVDGDVLVFVDADVRLAPGAVAAAHTMLLETGADVVYPFPAQEAFGAERVIQPLLQWSWLTTVPLRLAERSTRPSLAVANGQFVVIRRDALVRAGGFAAVRNAVLDDIALARAIRRTGGRTLLVDGSGLATARMYDGLTQVRMGYGKSLWSAFGSPAGAVATVASLTIVYVVPAVAAVRGSRAGVLAYVAGVASRVVAARASGGRAFPDPLVHPLSIAALGALTLDSLRRRRRSTLSWKGRPVR